LGDIIFDRSGQKEFFQRQKWGDKGGLNQKKWGFEPPKIGILVALII